MQNRVTQIHEAFTRAVETSPVERGKLLETLPPDVRAEIASLLEAHDSAGSFLVPSGDLLLDAGERLGPYVLIERIGQGGMGVVFPRAAG